MTEQSESFPNAPLIELVASIRWGVDADRPLDNDPRSGSPFLRELAREFAREGYIQSERLVPEDEDLPPRRPLYRYFNPADDEDSVVYQAGEQVLTINAIPPYRTWEDFRPAIDQGLGCLTRTLERLSLSIQPEQVSLNYIDAFDETFFGNDRLGFLRDGLGFDLSLPLALAKQFQGDDLGRLFFDFSGVGVAGHRIQIKTGLATVGNTPSVIFDMTVAESLDADLTLGSLIEDFDGLHNVIHDTFVGLTQDFQSVLRGQSQ